MIRKINDSDLQEVVNLENLLFADDPWTKSAWLYEMHENPFACILVCTIEEKVVGYIDYWIIYEQMQIANIAVHPAFQRQGLAQEMMNFAINEAIHKGCETLSLEVRVSNIKAINLYEKNGFITVSTRKGYYSNGEDAYLMVKPIGGLNDITVSD